MQNPAKTTRTPARKEELKELVFVRQSLPDFGKEIDHIDRTDGCKVWFKDGSWIICRFSGTEPLLRMAAENESPEGAKQDIGLWKKSLGL